MNILYVINKISHTSIPLEMAHRISNFEDVTVVSLYDSEDKSKSIVSDIAPKCKLIFCSGNKNLINGLVELRRVIRSGKYDVIHTHQTLSGAWARLVARKIDNIKLIHTIHANHDSFSFKQNLLIGLTLKYCSALVGNSYTTLKGLKGWQNWLTRKVNKVVIYNGVNSDEVRAAKSSDINGILEKYNISDENYIFGSVGRLEPVKNQEYILLAFDRFLDKVKEKNKYRLVLVGDGSLRDRLEEIIEQSENLKDQVIFTGMLPRRIVYALLHRFNAFIMASYYEGFCNALMEARITAVPTIVSNIDIFKELYVDEKMVAFDPNNVDEITDCMVKIIGQDIKSSNTNELSNKYDISTSVNQYLDLYRSV